MKTNWASIGFNESRLRPFLCGLNKHQDAASIIAELGGMGLNGFNILNPNNIM